MSARNIGQAKSTKRTKLSMWWRVIWLKVCTRRFTIQGAKYKTLRFSGRVQNGIGCTRLSRLTNQWHSSNGPIALAPRYISLESLVWVLLVVASSASFLFDNITFSISSCFSFCFNVFNRFVSDNSDFREKEVCILIWKKYSKYKQNFKWKKNIIISNWKILHN